ncbi:C40 family peptidase [Noviherbaspirillum sp.]|uniref:C40 family peptidase n=1 Tax=Noviherbaspirillum sp. TaxID=1926288 RepID=UPI002B496AA2|nr:C40 family peptidase [Noviherbaspirillum sp.]HJV80773.1 C40 family peptidase [Noviherbaspirillum sp.]
MATFLSGQRSRIQVRICALGISLCLAGLAYADDQNPATEQTTTLTRLQELTSRAKANASELVVRAMGLIGIRYKYGGTAPESGLDCSGLVRYLFKDVWGTDLPRTSEEMSRVGEKVDTQNLQPGDLVFYNTLRHAFSHVGIYLGNNKFIHSPSPGGEVRIESMDLSYWKKRFNGARRINEPE